MRRNTNTQPHKESARFAVSRTYCHLFIVASGFAQELLSPLCGGYGIRRLENFEEPRTASDRVPHLHRITRPAG